MRRRGLAWILEPSPPGTSTTPATPSMLTSKLTTRPIVSRTHKPVSPTVHAACRLRIRGSRSSVCTLVAQSSHCYCVQDTSWFFNNTLKSRYSRTQSRCIETRVLQVHCPSRGSRGDFLRKSCLGWNWSVTYTLASGMKPGPDITPGQWHEVDHVPCADYLLRV